MFVTQLCGEQSAPTWRGEEVERVVRGHETILAVEDHSLLLRLVTKQLESLGYKVLTASEGEPALAILRARSDIDMLFTDIDLPGGMNGFEIGNAAEIMRPGIKILYTSGYYAGVIANGGHLKPRPELLSKPYRRAELAARIRNVLDRHSPSVVLNEVHVR